LYTDLGPDAFTVVGVMCENTDRELPTTADCDEWSEFFDTTYPVVADEDGTTCTAWEYPEGLTTVFVLNVGGAMTARHDTTDPAVLETIRQDVDRLLHP
jgi:hypothetical protein